MYVRKYSSVEEIYTKASDDVRENVETLTENEHYKYIPIATQV